MLALWMRAGFAAFEAAERAAYPLFTGNRALQGCAIEVFPHGISVALKGSRPPAGTCRRSGRKRRWRAAILEAHRVEAEQLRSTDEVDAALAALTGLMALEGKFWMVGDPVEGVIVLPGARPSESFPEET